MRISIIANPNYPVPPFDGYGGTQRDAYDLSMGLSKRGHKVSVICSGDSDISNHDPYINMLPSSDESFASIAANDSSLNELYKEAQERIVSTVRSLILGDLIDVVNLRWERVDLIRELSQLAIPMVVSIPSIMPFDRLAKMHDIKMSSSTKIEFNVLTRSHHRAMGGHKWLKVVNHGISMDKAPFSQHPLSKSKDLPGLEILKMIKESGDDYLLHLGTISKRKGQMTSVEIATQADMPLIIAGLPNAYAAGDTIKYYNEIKKIASHNKNVYLFGNASECQKYELMKYAKATLFCSGYEDGQFQEPFGRVLAESAATGTPVVGYDYGSFSELIREGVTGYGFSNIDGAVTKVKLLDNHDRAKCSYFARKHMSDKRFIYGMESIMQDILS